MSYQACNELAVEVAKALGLPINTVKLELIFNCGEPLKVVATYHGTNDQQIKLRQLFCECECKTKVSQEQGVI